MQHRALLLRRVQRNFHFLLKICLSFRVSLSLGHFVFASDRANEFYKKGCQEKSSPSTGGEFSFSRSSPLKFRFSEEALLEMGICAN
jgi:hypothetical protein